MPRITVQESERAQTIKLEGKIAGLWVEEFNRAWQSLEAPVGIKELQLDLRGVAFVDAKGRELLRKIYQKTNARFLTDSPLTQYFADDARQHSPRDGEKGV
jgi:anti-anti-sigma regulatory factor